MTDVIFGVDGVPGKAETGIPVPDIVKTSDGTFLYPYDNRICYFDTLIEQF